MYQVENKRDEGVRENAVKLAISAIAAYKNSVIHDEYGTSLIETADLIAEYIVNGQVSPPAP